MINPTNPKYPTVKIMLDFGSRLKTVPVGLLTTGNLIVSAFRSFGYVESI